jgi:hypothetical protein
MVSRSLFCIRVAASLFLILSSGGSLASAAADEIAACTISAWSNDTDSNGLNIRSGAGGENPVVGQIPMDGEVSITGFKNGWFRIDQAVLEDYDTGVITNIFIGEGWVSGRLLGLLLSDPDLHAAPSEDSPVVGHLFHQDANGNVAGADSFGVTRLIACQGRWVQVEGTFFDTHLTGWSTGTCSNQVTTCS